MCRQPPTAFRKCRFCYHAHRTGDIRVSVQQHHLVLSTAGPNATQAKLTIFHPGKMARALIVLGLVPLAQAFVAVPVGMKFPQGLSSTRTDPRVALRGGVRGGGVSGLPCVEVGSHGRLILSSIQSAIY